MGDIELSVLIFDHPFFWSYEFYFLLNIIPNGEFVSCEIYAPWEVCTPEFPLNPFTNLK